MTTIPTLRAGSPRATAHVFPGANTKPVKEAPRVRSGLLDEARREGRLAVAQARGTIVSPSRVQVRVSSAPKQVVWVTWQLGCYKDRKARIGRGRYRAQTPNTRPIELPASGADSCIATVSAQLTRLNTKGRTQGRDPRRRLTGRPRGAIASC